MDWFEENFIIINIIFIENDLLLNLNKDENIHWLKGEEEGRGGETLWTKKSPLIIKMIMMIILEGERDDDDDDVDDDDENNPLLISVVSFQ